MSSPEPLPSEAARAAYREFLSLHPTLVQGDFEALCGRHPALAAELRQLHGSRLLGATTTPTVVTPGTGTPGPGRQDSSRAEGGEFDARAREGTARRYRLEGEIARGGMGAILKVWDNDLRRALAMKVILGEEERVIDDGSTAEVRLSRFLEEAQITGQLDHPGVVPVHELGVDQGGRVYFTMRLVKGRNFGEIINKVRTGEDGWSVTRALNVMHRVCETMAYAHQKGVVHRDLKPENVMVGQFGETYAMDWGLARVLGQPDGEQQRQRMLARSAASFVHTDRSDPAAGPGAESRTQQGVVVGTPCYMPPEQAAGDLERIGPHSDVYAIGAILYHLLTGKRPYAQVGSSVLGTVRAVLEGPPIPVHVLDPKVPAELVAICERAMARKPEDRYQSMVDMGADLRSYLEGRVVHAYQSGAVAEFVKWVRRNRGIAAAVAGLIVVAILGLTAVAWTQSEKAAAIATEQDLTRAARDEALANLDQARQQGYLANVTAANASLAAGETGEAKRHLADCFPALRGWEWHHLSLAADASIAVLDGGAGPITGLALDTSGTRVACAAADGTLRIWNWTEGTAAMTLAGDAKDVPMTAPMLAFLDGDRSVAAFGRQRDARVRVWDAASGRMRSQLALGVQALYAVAVSSRGDRVALGVADHSIHVVDPRNGDHLGALTGHQNTIRALAFSDDGALLLSGSEDRTVRIWSVADLRAVGQPIATPGVVYSVAVSSTGDHLVAGLEDGSICCFDRQDPAPKQRLTGHTGPVYGLAFHGDGVRLASASFDKTVRVSNIVDGRCLARLVGHDAPVHSVEFAAATTIVSGSADGSVRVWDVLRNQSDIVCRGPDESLAAVDVSVDGSRVVVGSSWPGTIEVFDAATGQRELHVSGPEDAVVALAFAPDGQRFAAAFQEESSLRLCELATGKLGEPLLGHEASVTSIAFTPDGATLVSGSADRSVRLWDVARQQAIGKPLVHDKGVASVAASADGKQVLAGVDDGQIHVWDLATGAHVRMVHGAEQASDGQRLLAVAWSPDGASLAAGYSDGTLRLFPPDASGPTMTLQGHDQSISALRYLPDGSRLVSGSFDGTVRVWVVATGRLALTMRGHTAPVTGVAAGGPMARIASTSHDGTLHIRQARRDGR